MNKTDNIKSSIYIFDFIEKTLKIIKEKDNNGFVDLDLVVNIIKKHPVWEFADTALLTNHIKENNLNRFLIVNNKIKLAEFKQLGMEKPISAGFLRIIPPKILYYKNPAISISELKLNGICSKDKRGVVVLYYNKINLKEVNFQFKNTIIEIDSFKAHKEGTIFYKESATSCFATFIKPKYIRRIF